MAGRMGNEQVTLQNLKVAKVDAASNLLLIKGADPRNQRRYRHRQDRSEGRCTRMSNLTLNVQTADGATNGSVDLPASIFDVEPSVPLMHQVVVAQLAAKRQGTHATKTRGQVSGGGKKPFRQKGTGRARQGSSARRTTPAVASSTARSRVTTTSGPPRR